MWKFKCPACEPTGTASGFVSVCPSCAALVSAVIEEAFFDLEARDHPGLRRFIDVIVRHAIPGDSRRVLAAARGTAPVSSEAETAKHTRYPATVGAPWAIDPICD